MKNKEKGFWLFYDWIDDLDHLNGDDAWKIVKALCEYHRSGKDPVEVLEYSLRAITSIMLHQIKRGEEISEHRSRAGRKSAFVRFCSNKSEQCSTTYYEETILQDHSFSLSGARTCEEADAESKTGSSEEAENEEPQNRAERIKRHYLGGTLGQGVILMSAEQFDDLCFRLSLDELERYMEIVVNCERSGKHYKKTHYQAILDMAEEDRKIGR